MIRLMLISVFALCSQSFALDIIGFNIGGYTFEVTRQTIENIGGPVLNSIVNYDGMLAPDSSKPIFIERPKIEGELLQYFLTTSTLPPTDETIIKNMVDYFQLEGLAQFISQPLVRKVWGYQSKIYGYHDYCPECRKGFEPRTATMFDRVTHLIDEHDAIMDCTSKAFLMYRIAPREAHTP